jgi:hypothetical protein
VIPVNRYQHRHEGGVGDLQPKRDAFADGRSGGCRRGLLAVGLHVCVGSGLQRKQLLRNREQPLIDKTISYIEKTDGAFFFGARLLSRFNTRSMVEQKISPAFR